LDVEPSPVVVNRFVQKAFDLAIYLPV
jgi:hypothetical protein